MSEEFKYLSFESQNSEIKDLINSGNIYAIKCEDLLKYYIGIRNENLKKLASDLSGNNQLEKIIPEKIEFSNEPLITEEEQKQLIKHLE